MTRTDLEAMFRAVDAAEWDAVARYFHPDLRYDRPGFARLEGREQVLRFYREVRTNRGEHRFDGFAIEADAGACWGRFIGAKSDGTPLDFAFADCYRFKDGLLWQRKSFFYLPLV